MKNQIIFVAGVHGAGKGYLVEQLRNEFPYPAFSASSLIKEVKAASVADGKTTLDAESNQDHLLTAISNVELFGKIFLDGHFCLFTNNGIFEVPEETFRGMNLLAIVLVVNKPEVIYQRLLERDGVSSSVEEISVLQKHEIDRANQVSSILGIRLVTLNSNSVNDASKFIRET